MSASAALAPIVADIRQQRRPQIVVFRVERLSSHTNADDQTIYRTAGDLHESTSSGDVIVRLEDYLLQHGFPQAQLQQLRDEVAAEVAAGRAVDVAGDGGQGMNECGLSHDHSRLDSCLARRFEALNTTKVVTTVESVAPQRCFWIR